MSGTLVSCTECVEELKQLGMNKADAIFRSAMPEGEVYYSPMKRLWVCKRHKRP